MRRHGIVVDTDLIDQHWRDGEVTRKTGRIHGHRTLFPIPLAEAGLFDDASWERSAREAAREAGADGLAMSFAPMLDVSRDPRWGRTAEGPGEDPYLATRIAIAKVRGFQGSDLASPDALAACAKHFCAYGGVNAGREYASVDISERTLQRMRGGKSKDPGPTPRRHAHMVIYHIDDLDAWSRDTFKGKKP